MARLAFALMLGLQLVAGKKEEDPAVCEVCRSVISQIDATITDKQRENVEDVEKVMRSWCDTAKGKDNKQLYHKACFRCVDCNTLLQAGQYEMCPIADEPRPKADLLCRRHHSERRLSGAWPLMSA